MPIEPPPPAEPKPPRCKSRPTTSKGSADEEQVRAAWDEAGSARSNRASPLNIHLAFVLKAKPLSNRRSGPG